MGMGNSFETITVLQYRLKEAQEEPVSYTHLTLPTNSLV